jgi:hypothetical protein
MNLSSPKEYNIEDETNILLNFTSYIKKSSKKEIKELEQQ